VAGGEGHGSERGQARGLQGTNHGDCSCSTERQWKVVE